MFLHVDSTEEQLLVEKARQFMFIELLTFINLGENPINL
jgi:hypothetical protein